jgi:hypothetical protein
MASTIPACKAAVLTVLAARPALTSVTRTWAGPTKDEDFVEEMIFLGVTEDTSEFVAFSGPREETYTLQITVWVELWGDDPQAAEERAHVLWDEVEDALRDDLMNQSGSLRAAGVSQFNRASRRTSTGPSTTEKWGASIEAAVEFQALNI